MDAFKILWLLEFVGSDLFSVDHNIIVQHRLKFDVIILLRGYIWLLVDTENVSFMAVTDEQCIL